jgi:inosose dehydratase
MNAKVRIGINPISWSNDDMPQLGAETSLKTILTEGAQIGYEGFELGRKFPRDPQVLKDTLAAHRVACVSGWFSGLLATGELETEKQRAHEHMHMLAFNGSKVVVYGEVADGIQGQMDTALQHRPMFAEVSDWQAYGERLTKFGEHLKSEYGITLAYHHHMGAYAQSVSDIDQLMAHTGESVGLLFDSGHAYFGGSDPLALLKKHIARVVHVHCKDVRARVIQRANNEQWSFLKSALNGAFTVPGDGDLDFTAIWSELKAADYQGWLVVEAEQDPALAPSYEYAAKGFKHIYDLVHGGSMN